MEDETAAPQAAAGGEEALEAVSGALRALRLAWGDEFMLGHDERGYWAARRRPGGGVLRAGTPRELGGLCAAATGAP